jgi:dUTP pyrophosphatase
MEITLVRDVKVPERGTSESAGLDFFVPSDFNEIVLRDGDSIKIPSGVKMRLPPGKAGEFVNKSSHGAKGLRVGACLVDSDYRGEVHLDVHYNGPYTFKIKPGMKIVQMVIYDVDLTVPKVLTNEAFSKYENTERGIRGFGSTGA